MTIGRSKFAKILKNSSEIGGKDEFIEGFSSDFLELFRVKLSSRERRKLS